MNVTIYLLKKIHNGENYIIIIGRNVKIKKDKRRSILKNMLKDLQKYWMM